MQKRRGRRCNRNSPSTWFSQIYINLPGGMNGLELVDWAVSNRPGVKVPVTTGRALDRDLPPIAGTFLAKPYTGRDLLDRVKQELSKPADGGTSGAGEVES